MEPQNKAALELMRGYLLEKLAEYEKLVQERLNTVIQVQTERHALYDERNRNTEHSTATALKAVEQQTALALSNQHEAAAKAEIAQDRYNVTHNDLIRRSDKQYEALVPRIEHDKVISDLVARIDAEARFRMNDREALAKEVAALREFRSAENARSEHTASDRVQQNWSSGQITAIAIAIGGWVITMLAFLLHYAVKLN